MIVTNVGFFDLSGFELGGMAHALGTTSSLLAFVRESLLQAMAILPFLVSRIRLIIFFFF